MCLALPKKCAPNADPSVSQQEGHLDVTAHFLRVAAYIKVTIAIEGFTVSAQAITRCG